MTGATGFLGTQITRQLIRDTDYKIAVLVRADNVEEAIQRLRRTWWDWHELTGAIGDRIEVFPGDVSLPRLGLNDADYGSLVNRITHIIHAAADIRIDAIMEELRKTNVQGTANILELAFAVHGDHRLARFS